ncbi:MAG: hypothetical protein QJR14_09530 [Bacillota bacterium]|nr:hypothetical protein [Bacillota bacterium]
MDWQVANVIVNGFVAMANFAMAMYTMRSAAAARAGVQAAQNGIKAQIRPLVTFDKRGKPIATQSAVGGAPSSRWYHFAIRNAGHGPAILGTNFFCDPDLSVLQQAAVGRAPFPPPDDERVADLQNAGRLPNILAPGDELEIKVLLGYQADKKPMENPWSFYVRYSDIDGNRYVARVTIATDSGDVLGIETKEGECP